MQSCGSHCPCDREAKPSSAETSGNHPTRDGTAGTRLTSLVVPGGGGHGAACHGPPGPPCPGSRGLAPRSAQNIPSLLCTGCPRAQPQISSCLSFSSSSGWDVSRIPGLLLPRAAVNGNAGTLSTHKSLSGIHSLIKTRGRQRFDIHGEVLERRPGSPAKAPRTTKLWQ